LENSFDFFGLFGELNSAAGGKLEIPNL